MSLMDVPETDLALAESYRVLKPGGFLQFSIAHPCFDTSHRRNLRDGDHRTYAIEVGKYFQGSEGEVDEWLFKAAPWHAKQGLRKFKIPRFRRTLSYWLNLLLETGFQLERIEEPHPSDETIAACPELQDAQVVSYFLHMRVRKSDVQKDSKLETQRKSLMLSRTSDNNLLNSQMKSKYQNFSQVATTEKLPK